MARRLARFGGDDFILLVNVLALEHHIQDQVLKFFGQLPGFVGGAAAQLVRVAAFDAEVERVVRDELELPLEKLFLEFDETPMAAASIGQVHRAVLPNGRRVCPFCAARARL